MKVLKWPTKKLVSQNATIILQIARKFTGTYTQETCADRGSNLGPLRDKRACYHLLHSDGL